MAEEARQVRAVSQQSANYQANYTTLESWSLALTGNPGRQNTSGRVLANVQ